MIKAYASTELRVVNLLQIQNDTNTVEYNLVRPTLGLYFPAVDLVCNKVIKAGRGVMPVVVDCQHFSNVDFTAAKVFIKVVSSRIHLKSLYLFLKKFILIKRSIKGV